MKRKTNMAVVEDDDIVIMETMDTPTDNLRLLNKPNIKVPVWRYFPMKLGK